VNLAAKTLLTAGGVLIVLGLLAWAAQSIPWLRIGRLPGDVRIERPGFAFYFPITTMLLLSLLVTGAFYMFARLRK
jgi:hypothetical protein